jgi:integrase
MRGHIHKRVHVRKDGSESVLYYAVVELPRSSSGKRKQDQGSGYKRKKDAEAALNRRLQEIENGLFLEPSRLTVSAYLNDHWLPAVKTRVKESTWSSYRTLTRLYLEPTIGHVLLQKLTPMTLTEAFGRLLQEGGRGQLRGPRGSTEARPAKPLSRSTVVKIQRTLNAALTDAVQLELLRTNPMKNSIKVRGLTVATPPAWTADELDTFLDAQRHNYLSDLYRFYAFTGVRRGEALALSWSDIDFEMSTIHVRRSLVLVDGTIRTSTPKSGHGRILNLDASTMAMLAARRQRAPESVHARRTNLVFADEFGSELRPDRVSAAFTRAVAATPGVARIPIHGLRHTHATLLLKAGVPVKVVSERLGHSDPSFTIRVYQSVLPGMQAEAANTFAALLRSTAPSGASTGSNNPLSPWQGDHKEKR